MSSDPHPTESAIREVLDVLNSEGFEHLVPVVDSIVDRLARTSMQLAQAQAALLEREDWIDPQRLRAIADALPGEKAAYLIAYQRGDWGVYAAREYGDLARAHTAAEAVAIAERAVRAAGGEA